MGIQNQFVVGYSIHQRDGDTRTHLDHVRNRLGKYPENLIVDAGYGNEENCAFQQENILSAYVIYNIFHYKYKRHYKKKKIKYRPENFKYLPDED